MGELGISNMSKSSYSTTLYSSSLSSIITSSGLSIMSLLSQL